MKVFQAIFQLVVLFVAHVAARSARLVGGGVAPAGSSPYIVSFQQYTKNGYVHFCGGAIINANWVVTAAHCITSKQVASVTQMVAGTLDIENLAETAQVRSIDYFVNHDLYLGNIAPYDIALMYTKKAFVLGRSVQAVGLPKAHTVAVGLTTLSGWGSTSQTSVASYPHLLHVVDVPVIPLTDCEKALGSMGSALHSTNMCTGPLTGGKGICSSDSGGPLVQRSTIGKDVLVGVVSWGKMPCGQPNSPSVYVQVASFIDWIESKLNDV